MIEQITFEAPLLRGRFIVFNSRPEFELLKIKQTHSDIVLNEDQCGVEQIGDGIFGNNNTPKAILTADCVPLVLIGANAHVVIHAGWKGLATNILGHPDVVAIKPTYAFIGPHIRPEHYEVQSDFYVNFEGLQGAFSVHNEKIYFNLEYVATTQLKALYPGIVIEDCGLDTFSDLKFHSYRRDKTTNRNWNIYFPK
ncbi:MAG: polyphenol oxidase family protein [Bacteriovorax sp.]|nr:polyphenol oxidase family protein [Bacteriovorax sp.]